MEFDFLRNFLKRMKHVGAYALLFKNSNQKQTWKQYGYETIYEQTNIIFSVLLYIMEQSLKEEPCTIDDIAYFLDNINRSFYRKSMSYEDSRALGEFIVTTILCDEGRAMYFQGLDYEAGKYQELPISFIANKILYLDGDVKRTSYFLTDDGYNLMLSTLEIENNMTLTIHEMIFKLHLEKASYDKAADDMKNIFNLMRMQLQRIQEAMRKIRQNALNYSINEYEKILDENISTINETKRKFLEYRAYVEKLVRDLEQQDIHMERLESKESENLRNLKVIENYLNRALDEHQKILSNHFDLKTLYTKELEALSQMSLIQRFSFRNDFYNEMLKDSKYFDQMEIFFRPLFANDIDKIYSVEKSCAYQKMILAREIEDSEEMIDFDNEAWLREQNEKQQKKLKAYQDSLLCLLTYVLEEESLTLSNLKSRITPEDKEELFPTVEVFRELMVELLKVGNFSLKQLKKEREEHFEDAKKQFQVSQCLLDCIEENPLFYNIREFEVGRAQNGETVEFPDVFDETGQKKRIRCSDVLFTIK